MDNISSIPMYRDLINQIISRLSDELTTFDIMTHYVIYDEICELINISRFARMIRRIRYMQHKLLSFSDALDIDSISLRSPGVNEAFVLLCENDASVLIDKMLLLFENLREDCDTLYKYSSIILSEMERLNALSDERSHA